MRPALGYIPGHMPQTRRGRIRGEGAEVRVADGGSDAQVLHITGGKPATHALVPVGCGSIAQAVAQHFRSAAGQRSVDSSAAAVLAVEPDTVACLRISLDNWETISVLTGDSVMYGMNCRALSTTAFKSGPMG
ncbi:Diaminopropionate ammonia-lyase [Parachaetomium inaequale]|uniref:Diaminopropionate ammonia-lyase n=1 Tax=Parachaetomium inaequale TaxID=2588326 RepID=A0AAN6PCI6_9PEZI|nr:Diaminopropionate ammonia-lyase [Parachaetomium inaequale]